MVKHLLLVGIGGAAGSILRYLAAFLTVRFFHGTFPVATFAVNVIGSFLIGLLMGLLIENTPSNHNLRLLLVSGFCGGFTTFSAFSYENLVLWNNNTPLALGYIAGSVIAGILAVWAGLKLA